MDCIRCGTCCFSESPRYVRVTGDDYERLDDDSLVEWFGNEAFMRMSHTAGVGHCAALVPSTDGTDGAFLCSVYERRPDVCRNLANGSAECEGERITKGGRPRRLLAILTRPA